MKISVTQEDINEGTPQDCWSCPIARAVQRATGFDWVEVDGMYVEAGGVPQKSCELPAEARRFVNKFDDGRYVEPFDFFLPELNYWN